MNDLTWQRKERDKAAKGEGWAPPFISCAQDTVGFYPPPPHTHTLALLLLGYGIFLPFVPFKSFNLMLLTLEG